MVTLWVHVSRPLLPRQHPRCLCEAFRQAKETRAASIAPSCHSFLPFFPAILSCAPDLQFGFHTHVCGLCQLLRKLRALLCLKKGRQPEIVSFSRRSLCFAKILSALKIARFPVATAVPSRLSLHPRTPRISPGATPARYACVYKDGGTGRFRDATLVRIRQPDRTAGTTVVRQNSGRL
jgi:hypothetical protein